MSNSLDFIPWKDWSDLDKLDQILRYLQQGVPLGSIKGRHLYDLLLVKDKQLAAQAKQLVKLEITTSEFIKENEYLSLSLSKLKRQKFTLFSNEECWIYSGVNDHLESLVCPVVISAQELIRIKALAQLPAEVEGE